MDTPYTIFVSGGCGVGKSALRWLAPKYWRASLGDCAALDLILARIQDPEGAISGLLDL